jgi:hypothetical protein
MASLSLRIAEHERRTTTGKRAIAPAARAVLPRMGGQQVQGPFDGEMPSMITHSSAFVVAGEPCSLVPGGPF